MRGALTPTMSSRDIAELTGKDHKHVIRDIDRMIEDLRTDGPNVDHELLQGVIKTTDSRGYTAEIRLPKDLTLTLIAGYRADLRLRIIRRWMELEDGRTAAPPAHALPQTFVEALRALTRRAGGRKAVGSFRFLISVLSTLFLQGIGQQHCPVCLI